LNIEIIPWNQLKEFLAYPDSPVEPSFNHLTKGIAVAGAALERAADRCILIMSRVPHKLSGDEPWLAAVQKAVDHAWSNGWTIVSSVGNLGWDYITWCAAKAAARIWLVFPPMQGDDILAECNRCVEQLRLDPEKNSFLVPLTSRKLPKSYHQQLRDRFALGFSHHRLPIFIRPKGNWVRNLTGVEGIDKRFQVPLPRKYVESWRKIRFSLIENCPHDWGDLLIHWTRGSYAPWPGETQADYFEALTETETGNPRDGLATLKFIAASGILRGEGRMVRSGVPVISLSDLAPHEALQMIEFRPALGRWSFEPYGIAFPKQRLSEIGARKVIYGSKELYDQLPPEDKPYYQYEGRKVEKAIKHNWRKESEWRLTGDIDLLSLKSEVILVTPTEEEAGKLRSALLYNVYSLEKGPV